MKNRDNGGNQRLRLTKDGKVFFRGTKTYTNGDFYEGEFVDGLRHGVGKFRFHTGDRFEGEFERNYFHGFGVYLWNTVIDDQNNVVAGRKYEGEWKDGKRHGKGIYFSGTNDVYSGYFANDQYHGEGILKLANGDSVEGEFVRGRASGQIKIKYASGDIYSGGILAGHFEGRGKLIYAGEMGSYEGEWHAGNQHGKGARIYSDGSKYVGDFIEGEKEGEGMMFFINGDQYLGGWKRGHMEGKGVYQYRNGDVYEGEFIHGVRYGAGKFIYKDGSFYHGEYRNIQKNALSTSAVPLPLLDGKRHGTGIRVWSSGARYEGQWMEDRMHGSGVMNTSSGGKYEGGFLNNLRHGKNCIEHIGNLVGMDYICPLGNKHYGAGFCVFTGSFAQGLFHGHGEVQCITGQYYKGEWRRGKKHGQGEQYFVRNGESGDTDRLNIGGVDFLYRVLLYKGTYEEDIREGLGILTYTNGDTLEGNFSKGQPHGIMVYRFASAGKVRLAKYIRGDRTEWIEIKNKSKSIVPRKSCLRCN